MIRRMTHGSAPNRAREASQRPGSFEKGHVKMGGRTQGTPNLMTRELKAAIFEAAHRLGSDGKGKDGVVGYLTHLAKNDIKTFVTLLSAVLPLQIKEEAKHRRFHYDDEPVRYPTVAEIRQELRERGFPFLLKRIEPVVRLMNSGKSASEAMRAVGFNAKLQRVGKPLIELDPLEEYSLCSGDELLSPYGSSDDDE
jgi:hypothetical protein